MTDSEAQHDLVLTDVQKSVERCVLMLKGRLMHCGRSAFRHMRRAWEIKDIAPELAAFSMITAEEEAATAIILCLKSRGYPGADKLNHQSHPHKLSITPFLLSAAEIFELLDYAMPEIKISEGKDTYKVILRVDANKLFGFKTETKQFVEPVPPLHFVINDGSGPLDFTKRFSEFTEGKGFDSIVSFVTHEANFRNKLLYASDTGIAHVRLPEGFFAARVHRVTNLFVILLLIAQSPEKQLFVCQCLDALLQIHRKINESQFSFEPLDPSKSNLINVEKLDAGDPNVTFTRSFPNSVELSYVWRTELGKAFWRVG